MDPKKSYQDVRFANTPVKSALFQLYSETNYWRGLLVPEKMDEIAKSLDILFRNEDLPQRTKGGFFELYFE